MKTICFHFNKGGVGKSTLSVLVAHAIAEKGYKVVFLDNDPQANSTQFFLNNLDEEQEYEEAYKKLTRNNIFTLLKGESVVQNCLLSFSNTPIKLIGATPEYETAKNEFSNTPGHENRLRVYLEGLECDYLIVDTPGELSLLTNWSLSVANTVVIPVQTEMFAVEALPIALQRINEAQKFLNPDLKTIFIVPNLFDARKNSCKVSLRFLQNTYSYAIPHDDEANEDIAIHYSADISNFIACNTKLPKSSKSYQAIQQLAKRLYE